jgi:hypothetical protein
LALRKKQQIPKRLARFLPRSGFLHPVRVIIQARQSPPRELLFSAKPNLTFPASFRLR